MDRVVSKLNGFVLLFAFVMTTLGSVPGFAWCIGEDGHFEVEYVATGDCGDVANRSSDSMSGESFIHKDDDHCGPCLDFYLQSHEAVSASKLNQKTTKDPGVLVLNSTTSSITSQSIRLAVDSLSLLPPPRISQAVLNHRTTVLLI